MRRCSWAWRTCWTARRTSRTEYGDLPDTRLSDNYFVAVFGTPGDESGWSWRIGGHHLSLHYTVRDGLVYPTPAFFGAEPARSTLPGGVVLRPLAAEEDCARDLLALNDAIGAGGHGRCPPPTSCRRTGLRSRTARCDHGGHGPGGERLGHLSHNAGSDMVRYSLTPKGLQAPWTARRPGAPGAGLSRSLPDEIVTATSLLELSVHQLSSRGQVRRSRRRPTTTASSPTHRVRLHAGRHPHPQRNKKPERLTRQRPSGAPLRRIPITTKPQRRLRATVLHRRR